MAEHRRSKRSLRKGLGVSLVLLSVLAVAAGALVYWRSQPRGAYGYYIHGVKSMNARDYARAHKALSEAARLSATNASYHLAAAQAASALGAKEQARLHAEKAWDLGLKSPTQLNLILNTFEGRDRTNELRRALELWNQLPRTTGSEELRGDILFFFGRADEAIDKWQQLLARTYNPALVVKTANACRGAGRRTQAIEVLEKHLAGGGLNESGYSLLASLYILDDAQFPKALSVFDDAKKKGRYGEGLKLEHAVALLIHQRAGEAQPLLESLSSMPPERDTNRLSTSARLFLGVIYAGQTNRSGLAELLNQSRKSGSGSIREGEELFHQAQLLRLDKQSGVLEKLQTARRIIPDHAAVQLLHASQCNALGSHAAALEACRSVQGIMARWPAVQLELALALHKTGKDAEALRVLDQIHRRGFASKDSLALMRDAAYGSRQTQRGQSTQSMLERQFPGDPEIKFYSGYSALRQGAYDRATAIFQELSDRFPAQVRYKLAEIQVMLARGESRSALEALRKLDAKPELLAPLVGIAHARVQEWEQAASAFATAVKSGQPAGVHVEYGMVLLQMNQADDASHQFDLAFARDPRQLDARLGLALAAYSQENLEAARRQGALLVNNPEMDVSRLLFLAAAEMRFEQFTNALEFCRLALAKDPESPDARAIRGTVFGLMDRFAEAEQDLAWASAKKPADFAVRRELARVYLRSGQFAKALANIDAVLAGSPGDRNMQAIKFETLARSKQFDAAQSYLSSVQATWPASQFALNSSLLAELKGERVRAASLIEPHLTNNFVALQWARLRFESGDALGAVERLGTTGLTAAQWGGLAVLAEGRGLTNVAPACYQEALEMDPNNPILLNNWAWSAVQLPGFDAEKVVSACRRAYAALPRNPAVMDTYADVLLRAGRYADCVGLLEGNLALVHQTPQLLWLLGGACEGAGQREKALAAYNRCQDLLKKNVPGLRAKAGEVAGKIEQLRAAR